MANTPVTNFRFPPGFKTWIKQLADERGISLTDATMEALTEWGRKQERKRR